MFSAMLSRHFVVRIRPSSSTRKIPTSIAKCACRQYSLDSVGKGALAQTKTRGNFKRKSVEKQEDRANGKIFQAKRYSRIQPVKSVYEDTGLDYKPIGPSVNTLDNMPTESVNESDMEQDTDHTPFIGNSIAMSTFKSKLCQGDELNYSHDDWKNFEMNAMAENTIFRKCWEPLCMQLMYHYGCTNLASSLMDYLSTGSSSPKITTLSLYIALQGKFGGKNKEQIIQETYTNVLKISDVFDAITAKYLIFGLSCTSQYWRTTLDILEMVRLTSTAGPVYYSPIILAALRENDVELAFKMMDELASYGFTPPDILLQTILNKCETDNSSNLDLLEKYFAHMKKYNCTLSMAMAKAVELHFTSLAKERWACKWTTIDTVRGICQECNYNLDRIDVPPSDFEALQREFLEKALLTSNVYIRSNPQEVERFQDFVMENAPFDVVLDALNIAFSGNRRLGKSKQLREVVHYFARERHMKVLVIGRNYMQRWSEPDMNYINRHAKTFFTENISSDDLFALYATLYSGKDCLFVSKDFFRNHKFDLGPRFKEVFENWQKSRQIFNFSVFAGGVSIKMPSQYHCGPVKNEEGWHIPYDNGNTDLLCTQQAVLCLRHKGECKTPQTLRKQTNSS